MMRDSIAQELIAKANQAILEAHCLRRQGRSLRLEASVRASELGETVLESSCRSDQIARDGDTTQGGQRQLTASDQLCQVPGHCSEVERLFPEVDVPKLGVDGRAVESGREYKGNAACPQKTREGKNHLAAQIDVDDGGIDRKVIVEHPCGVLELAAGTEHACAKRLQCAYDVVREEILVLDHQDMAACQRI